MCPLAVAAAHTQPSVAILKLAIGISASTTAVTRINAVLLQPLSEVTEPNRLVALESVHSTAIGCRTHIPTAIHVAS
jgi:hypothetical protein